MRLLCSLVLLPILVTGVKTPEHPVLIAVPLEESYRFRLVENPDITDHPTVATVFRAFHAVCVINGGFFDENFKPVGYYKVDGEVLSSHASPSLSGYVCIDQEGALSIHYKSVEPDDYVSVFQAGPLLIDPGGKPGIHSDDGKAADRSAIVQLDDGTFVFLFHERMTLFALSQYLLSKYPTADRAINLDGGPEAGIATRIPALRIHENTIASKAYLIAVERNRGAASGLGRQIR
jgi:uncharacterized protein YigE (DUF2233 family)